MSSKLEQAIVQLLIRQPFYGNLILAMKKQYSTKHGIAAVSITDTVNLYINPELFNQLAIETAVGILIHECKHITHDHISRGKRLSKKMNKGLNIAADRSINEMLADNQYNGTSFSTVPDSFTLNVSRVSEETLKTLAGAKIVDGIMTGTPVTVKNFQESFPDKKIENGQTMEYYYRFLKDNAKGNGDGENSFDGDMDSMDDHSAWEESEENDEVREQTLKNAIKKASERTAPGNMPGEVKELLEKWGNASVNWKKELKRFVSHCIHTKLESSRKKRNRRYGVMYPGFKKTPELKIVCAIDTSGSVSTKMVEQFFGEMAAISDLGIEITVIECDTVIQKEYTFDKKNVPAIDGRGGTSFHPVFTKVAKMRDVDALIYFTDGECFEEVEYTKPTLWAITPCGSNYSIPKGGENRHIKIRLED